MERAAASPLLLELLSPPLPQAARESSIARDKNSASIFFILGFLLFGFVHHNEKRGGLSIEL